MNKQGRLFDPAKKAWVERLWRRIPAQERQKIVALLATMGQMAMRPEVDTAREEVPDES